SEKAQAIAVAKSVKACKEELGLSTGGTLRGQSKTPGLTKSAAEAAGSPSSLNSSASATPAGALSPRSRSGTTLDADDDMFIPLSAFQIKEEIGQGAFG